MLLESFIYRTSIAVNHGSHFQVRFVWQLLDGQLYHPPLNVYKILQLLGVEMRPGYDTAPRQDSKGKGSAKEETKHVHCRKLNKRNFCLTSVYKSIYNIYHSPYVSNIYIYTHISMYVCVCIYMGQNLGTLGTPSHGWLMDVYSPVIRCLCCITISCYYNYNILLFFFAIMHY